ncbi:CAP-Gly domain-containing linker protein 4 isoform X2 [Pelodiscus sinensis]|uniref:CAP-Gly domain-containing linker protein 4 isoform X2 n=1 Tax=Pelodiscus sinensis TaxID=13735 RepID=UPI000703D1E8|nr:CAP-Gly domain-containing linker protein 4 isoform X2 [Pelodiscus sinensis]|eukprot:XP_014425274.1 CAP-Gly domain-containing linker protein 4 isoform X2 [Pelodiscus sinensis]
MTIEDLPEPSQEGESLIERYQFLFPGSETSVTFSVAAAPMPSDCEFSFFDPNDAACQEILFNPKTSVSELFAILRQWVPQVQQNIDIIGNEIIKRGCSVNDRDGLTDMTLLHYTCKSGAHGIDVDATCSDFDFGTALHIAAFNLCTAAVKCLLEHGANPAFRNDKGQIPADVVPDPVDMPLEMADAAASAKEIKQMLLDAVPLSCDISKAMLPSYDHVTGKAMLMSLGLKLGDRVVIAGQKVGTLRFCGTTEFASGQWAGVELDDPEGKNDGSVGNVQYFKCAPKCGIFAPLSKISKASDHKKNFVRSPSTRSSTLVKSKKIDVTHITSKVNTGLATFKKDTSSESTFLATEEGVKTMPGKEGLNNASPSTKRNPFDEGEIQLGDKVLVVGQRTGTVRFYGTTKFAPGFWCGIELNKPHGKNDGSVGGVQYFSCLPKYGIFAPPTRVQKLTGSLDSLTEISSGKMNQSFPGFRRSLSTTSASSQKEISRRNSFVKSKSSALRRSWSNTTTTNTEGPVKLHEGSQVLLTSSNEMGTIRYIGPTDFAPGIWLGLELRSAKGKNDGSVGDKRYFTCKTNHGVLVRPSRVTYRGINGAKLVDDSC